MQFRAKRATLPPNCISCFTLSLWQDTMKTDSRTKLEKKSQEVVRMWEQLDKQLGIGYGATLSAPVAEWVQTSLCCPLMIPTYIGTHTQTLCSWIIRLFIDCRHPHVSPAFLVQPTHTETIFIISFLISITCFALWLWYNNKDEFQSKTIKKSQEAVRLSKQLDITNLPVQSCCRRGPAQRVES